MYRFLLTPRWIAFHLLVLVAIVTMVNLGFWQLRRLDERRALNEQVEGRVELPVLALDDVLGPASTPAGVEWRSVAASGRYLPDEEVTVVNRSQGGAAGDVVVTPLQLDDGRILLVQRGFVPLGADAAPAPAGTVDITGRLRPSQERRRGQLSDPSTGDLTEAQRLDIARLAPQLPGEPVEMYVELTSSTPSEPGPYPAPLSVPELGDGPHLSYAGQWFIFAAAAAVGWVLAVRKSLNARRAGPPPVDVASTTAVAAASRSSSG